MALSLKLRYELSNSDRIIVFDDTGVYHPTNNPGGWGGGVNPNVGDAVSLVIVVTRPDDSTLETSSDPSLATTISAYNTLPSLSGNYYTIFNTDIGLTQDDTIPDGEYEFYATMTVVISGTPTTFISRVRNVFYYNTFKCKEDKKNKIDFGCIDKCDTLLKDIMIMELGFDGIDYNVEKSFTKSAVKILSVLKSMCCSC